MAYGRIDRGYSSRRRHGAALALLAQFGHRQRSTFAQQPQMVGSPFAILHRQAVQEAKPGVLIGPIRCSGLFGQFAVPDIVAVSEIGPVVQGLFHTLTCQRLQISTNTEHNAQHRIRIGTRIEKDAQHLGVHLQDRAEQRVRTIPAATAWIGTKPQHFLDTRYLGASGQQSSPPITRSRIVSPI